MPDLWPRSLIPVSVSFHPQIPSRSGGLSVTGDEQIVVSNAGRWSAKLSFNIGHGHHATRPLGRKQDSVLAWRAMLARAEGRSFSFLIGPYDTNNAPAAVAGEQVGPFDIPHDDDTLFSDGVGYDQFATPAHIYSAASLGATSIVVVMEAGHEPEAGQYFGIGNRLYLIKRAVETSTPDRWTLTFWPPLRADVEGGDVVNFDNPVCEMRFAADDVGQYAASGPLYFGTGPLDLVEVKSS